MIHAPFDKVTRRAYACDWGRHERKRSVRIKVGCELLYECPKPTPMLLTLNIHYSRASDLEVPDHLVVSPPLPLTAYRDGFGNWVTRIVAPAGLTRVSTNAIVRDNGLPDVVVPTASQHLPQDLPEEALCSCSPAAIARRNC